MRMCVCVSERCFALGVAAGYSRQGCVCRSAQWRKRTRLYTHSSRAHSSYICHWEAATGARREERGSRHRSEEEKCLSMDVLQDWALEYPALARLLWVIVLVLATVLVWSLFFCWGSQSSTSPLERYLSGNIAALILPQLTWNQFLLILFSSFRISSRCREFEEEFFIFFCSDNMLAFHDWLLLVGTAWKSGWVVFTVMYS